MIKFEINKFPFAITNDQFDKISDIIRCAPELDYDVVEGDTAGLVWLWAHHEVDPECENPTRYWIGTDGTVDLAEEVTWEWENEGVEVPTPRVEMESLYPMKEGEPAGTWTDRVLTHSAKHEVNRQCSIGYHGECSDRAGAECRCLCHDDATRWFTVEGHGTVITRAEQGKEKWPPVPGEPPNMWAEWIMATSTTDATQRAIKKQEARRG